MKNVKLYPDAQLPYPYSADLLESTESEEWNMKFGQIESVRLEHNRWSDGITRVTFSIRGSTAGLNVVLMEYEKDEDV